MKDELFKRTMEVWAEQEQAAAPRMRPTQEMYRLVEAKQKRGGFSVAGMPRWARLGATIASVLLVALAYAQFYQQPTVVGPPVAVVRVREAFPSGKGQVISRPSTARRGAPKQQLQFFETLDFQYRSPEAVVVTALDLRQPTGERTVLSAAASYRLALEPARDCHVYVFQQSFSEGVEPLFPSEAYSDLTNPLHVGEAYYLPSPPGGFHLGAEAGEQRLYVVAASDALPELLQAYESYADADDGPARQQALAALLDMLDGIEAAYPDRAVRWTFDFSVR
jgi:hypothetical protein